MKYLQLVKAIDSASQELLGRAATVVNQALVIRNWLIGAYIVEFEQNGEDRAKYGARLLETLAADLKQRGLAGLGLSTLERTRRCYLTYPQLAAKIPSPLVTELSLAWPEAASGKPSAVVPNSRRAGGGNSVTTGYGIGKPLAGQSGGIPPL
jgi:hypothetical protein